MLLGTLGASLLGNLLIGGKGSAASRAKGEGIMRAGDGIGRAGEGNIVSRAKDDGSKTKTYIHCYLFILLQI